VLRHWRPAAAVTATVSHRMRRIVLSALLVDAVVAIQERDATARLSPLTLAAGRRLDDLAYGAGRWWGALKARSPRALLLRRPGGQGT
jgi:hypothetical protein